MGVTRQEVTFDDNLLTQVNGLSILAVSHFKLPNITLANFLLSRTDRRKINNAQFTEKHVGVRCYLSQNSRELLDVRLDDLKALLQEIERPLYVPHGTARRVYTATLNDLLFPDDEINGSTTEFTLDFILSDVYGYDPAFTQLVYAAGRTLYNYTDNFIIGGSAKWQVPIIKVTFTALTGGANADVTVTNPATRQSIIINRTWLAGDVLEIDAQNQTVKVNNAEVEYSGSIPEWKRGVGYVQVQDQFLTRTKTMFMYNFRRWA